jgi:hypothetical protein
MPSHPYASAKNKAVNAATDANNPYKILIKRFFFSILLLDLIGFEYKDKSHY